MESSNANKISNLVRIHKHMAMPNSFAINSSVATSILKHKSPSNRSMIPVSTMCVLAAMLHVPRKSWLRTSIKFLWRKMKSLTAGRMCSHIVPPIAIPLLWNPLLWNNSHRHNSRRNSWIGSKIKIKIKITKGAERTLTLESCSRLELIKVS